MNYGFYTKNTKIGDVFNDFTVIELPKRGRTKVQCKCGSIRVHQTSELHQGRRKSCGCERGHEIGEIVNGRKVVALGNHSNPCLTVECLDCGHQAKVRAGYNESAACRNCEAFAPVLKANGTVYAIVCPFTGDVVYVGATTGALELRLRDHFKSTRHPKKKEKPFYQWLAMLMEQGAEPGIITLETVEDDTLLHREVFWIKKLRAEGYRLLNLDHNIQEVNS